MIILTILVRITKLKIIVHAVLLGARARGSCRSAGGDATGSILQIEFMSIMLCIKGLELSQVFMLTSPPLKAKISENEGES